MNALLRLLFLLGFVSLAGAPLAQQAPSDYLLGPGDLVRINVFQNPDLSIETRVSEQGTITFPLIGSVGVGGQSVSQVERVIAERLRDGGFVNRPQVNVVVLLFKSIQVSVLGQVNKPGRYPLDQSKNRLTEVLALAGGVTSTGSDIVTVVTTENGKERKFDIDVPALIQSGDLSKDLPLQNGDVIYVPRAPLFYIHGEVQRPGQYRVERDMTVVQALATGGGLTIRGTTRGMKLSRRTSPSTPPVTRDANMNEPVLPDDVIHVQESLF